MLNAPKIDIAPAPVAPPIVAPPKVEAPAPAPPVVGAGAARADRSATAHRRTHPRRATEDRGTDRTTGDAAGEGGCARGIAGAARGNATRARASCGAGVARPRARPGAGPKGRCTTAAGPSPRRRSPSRPRHHARCAHVARGALQAARTRAACACASSSGSPDQARGRLRFHQPPPVGLDAARKRASQLAREGTGQRALLPFPMPAPPERKTRPRKRWRRRASPIAARIKDLGLLAAVPLIANEFGEGTCRW